MTMATAEAPNAIKSEHFDPDNDVVLRSSPVPAILNLKNIPSPDSDGGASDVSTPPVAPGSPKDQKRYSKAVASKGDEILLQALGGPGAPQEIAEEASRTLIPSESDDEAPNANSGSGRVEMPDESIGQSTDLEALAAGALRAFNSGEVPPPTKLEPPPAVEGPVDDHRHLSPKLPNINGNHELAPIQVTSPKAEKSANVTLPSISAQLGDLTHLAEVVTATVDAVPANGVHRQSISSQSPPQPLLFQQVHHQQPGHGHTSPPPISPLDNFRNGPSPAMSANQFYYSSNPRRPSQVSDGLPYSSASEYTNNVVETPGPDLSGSVPNGIPAGLDRMSIDGITNPVVGAFQCRYPNCQAQPFQTQYLLNSHANVHSQNRPHYCPVKGCQRSEGGKGFKRKNEMIRHGLVHESPGYVCPYCMDREHKYPRPDNLQRHVRVHHVDKDKDDPQLREVLAQRPEGPSRGRRRRGGNN